MVKSIQNRGLCMFENMFQKYITVKNIIFFIIAILFIVIIFKIFDIAIMFFASFVIACSLEPIVQKLSAKFSRKTSCSIALTGALLIIFAFLIPIISIGSNEIKIFANSFPQYIENVKEFIYTIPFIHKETIAQINITEVLSSVTGTTSKIFEETVNAGKSIGSAFVYFIVSVLIVYYFMVDKDKVKETILKLFPIQMRKKTAAVLSAIADKTGGYLIAQIVTMVSVGLVVYIGLLLLRSEYALLLGLITALLDIIPVVGPIIAFIICIIAVYKSGTFVLVCTAIIFGVAQLAENNFVRPFVFSKFLNIHPLIIYLFLFIAAKYMGLLGIIFAPAIAATVVVLIEEVYIKSLE